MRNHLDVLTAGLSPTCDGHTMRNHLGHAVLTSRVVLVPVAEADERAGGAVSDGLLRRADHTLAVHVRSGESLASVRRLLGAWDARDTGVPLIVLDSPDGDVALPILEYVRRRHHRHQVTVLLPPPDEAGGWSRVLGAQHVSRIAAVLVGEPNVRVERTGGLAARR